MTVRIPEEWMYQEDRQLAPFRVERVDHPHVFTFEKRDVLSEPPEGYPVTIPGMLVYRGEDLTVRYVGAVNSGWENAYLRAEHRDRQHRVQLLSTGFPGNIGIKPVLNALEAEHLVTEQNGCIFHCSFIRWNGKAVLFTAPSQTGKSTQAELWHLHRDARIINGDRAAVGLVNGVPMAQAIPFAGSSQYCVNRSVPLKAIVCLGQAKENRIMPLTGASAFRRVWEG